MEIERVFVARRPLSGAGTKNWQKLSDASHSALLLRTVNGEYYILEYMQDSQAHLYEILLEVTETIQNPPHEKFKLEGVEWTKQLHGKALSGWTLDRAKSRMEGLMTDGYSLIKYEVCHTAQERLRKDMGIMD